jgi:hypothetical protein
MPPDEMYALERAALEDPMLADALEGYAIEKQGEDALLLIRQKLDAKFPNGHAAKIVSFNKKMWSAVAVAASLLIIGSYAFFAMQTEHTGSTNEPQLALKQPTPKKDDQRKSTSDNTNAKLESGTTLSADAIQPEAKKTAEVNTNASTSATVSSTEGAFKAVMPYTIPNIESNNDEDLSKLNTQDDDFQKKNKEDADKKAVTASSTATGYFQTDSNLATNWAVADVKNQQVALESTQQNNKFFDIDENDSKKNATSLNEVVVITGEGYKKERKKASAKATTAAVSKFNAKELQNPFAAYLVNQQPTCYKTDGEKAAGNVVLDFKVDKKGRPMNIKVSSSLSDACDKEAIRLLSSGPDWEIKGPRLRKVVISFQ